MHIKPMLAIPICLFGVFVFWITGSNGLFIPNLTEQCYNCLCHVATECNLKHRCTQEKMIDDYCGPFNISKVYWEAAGKIVWPEDDPERNHAWSDCARNYDCAKQIIEGYLQKFGQDCNSDGITNCYDYMMILANGGYNCTAPLKQSKKGKLWLKRYEDNCRL